MLQLLDKCGGGVLQLDKRREIMKNRNPYLSCIILWICAICVALSFSIYGIVSSNLFLAISQLVFIVFDSIYLGWAIRRFNEYK